MINRNYQFLACKLTPNWLFSNSAYSPASVSSLVAFGLFHQVLSFGSKLYLSGLGELILLKNVNQTSSFMQVALKTSLEAA